MAQVTDYWLISWLVGDQSSNSAEIGDQVQRDDGEKRPH
jgi:hypothetical protein